MAALEAVLPDAGFNAETDSDILQKLPNDKYLRSNRIQLLMRVS